MFTFFRRFLIGFTTVLSVCSAASVVVPDDGPYSSWRGERILYVYDAETRGIVPQIAAYIQAIRTAYDSSFNWSLDQEQDLILASSRQQVANAYATVTPNIKSVWFPSGSSILPGMAQSSWFLTLATHETSHLYQLDAKGKFNASLAKVFGNSTNLAPLVWPIFLNPNQLTPTFLIEGNAVFNESRANMGGRLHSGEVRALVLAQIKAGQIDANRLINNEFRFPFGTEPYEQGGYFQAHLATKYGVDKTNQFFLAQGDHYLWPLILNKTFRDHFGASYAQEIREYLREWEGLAKNQQAGTGKVIREATYIAELNHDHNRIFFMASDGIYSPKLCVFDKRTGTFQISPHDLPLGKVFWRGETPLTTASEQHDLHHIEYSLYGEDHAIDPQFRGQIVSDARDLKVAALDASHSWLDPRILLNGEFYDIGHSAPILDEDGNVYYFRQNGLERILYKNRQPLFKYEGFYGKPTEVGADGSIYFIANTIYGASLYQYNRGEILRVLSSDRVVDARQIDENRFLALEVGTEGYRALLADATRKVAQPVTYSYGFTTYNLKPEPLVHSEKFQSEERPYNSLAQIRYSGLDFVSQYDRRAGFGVYVGGHFVDPLQYQQLDLVYSGTQFRDQAALAQYTFTKYLAKPFVRYLYQRQYWSQANDVDRLGYSVDLAAGLQLPLLRWHDWDASWTVAGVFGRDDKEVDPSAPPPPVPQKPVEETYGTWNSLSLQYSLNPDPMIGFYPLRSVQFNLQNRFEYITDSEKKRYNTSLAQVKYQEGFPLQFYSTLSGNVAWAENHDVNVDYNPLPLSYNIRIPRLTAHDPYTVKTASTARFELTKVFDTPLYSPRFPLGLDRVAPFLVAQGVFLDSAGQGYGNYPANIFEWGYGADIQILLAHLAHAKLRILQGYDTRHPIHKGDTQGSFALEARF